jgi:hypothetical protein
MVSHLVTPIVHDGRYCMVSFMRSRCIVSRRFQISRARAHPLNSIKSGVITPAEFLKSKSQLAEIEARLIVMPYMPLRGNSLNSLRKMGIISCRNFIIFQLTVFQIRLNHAGENQGKWSFRVSILSFIEHFIIKKQNYLTNP